MSILEQIIKTKLQEIAVAKRVAPLQMVRQRIEQMPRIEHRIIKTDELQLIAEIKAKSPSKGILWPDFNPVALAHTFTTCGATALSVLTDHDYFGGSLDMFRKIRQTTSLPILRKDFIIDPYQVYETKAAGADIILLIVRAIPSQLAELAMLSVNLGLQVLVEVHDTTELNAALSALKLSPQIMIGINNRNLDTFTTDTETSIALIKDVPSEIVCVAESGLKTTDDLAVIHKAGFDAALIGEGLAVNPQLLNYFNDHETY